MTDGFKVTLAQLNPRVGDLDYNRESRDCHAWQAAREEESDYLLLPEMFMTGYQVQDLVLKPAFTRDAMHMVESLAARTYRRACDRSRGASSQGWKPLQWIPCPDWRKDSLQPAQASSSEHGCL